MLLLLCMLVLGDTPTLYGNEANPSTIQITIEQLMADPEAYLGKEVMVVGKVSEVCPMKGCWMDVASEKDHVRIKVKDGEIVFDQELVGKKVQAYGTVYKFELSKEEAVNYFKHLAEEKGEAFDPATITAGTTVYQIGGIGAKVI